MKVLHVIPSLSPVHGGPSLALPLMAKALERMGVKADVATTDDDGPRRRMGVPLGTRVEKDGFGAFYFRKQTEFYKCSGRLGRWIRENVTKYDLVHIHALFSWSSLVAARAARAEGVPYIVRPLGVLNRWGVQNRRPFLKSLSLRFVERPILRDAAAMHYTSAQEQMEAEEAGAVAPGFVIPLDIQPEKYDKLPPASAFLKRFPQVAGKKIILFLSRIDPKKGIELLLGAFARIRASHSDALLVIAGSGAPAYIAELKKESIRLGIEAEVVWTGFLEGEEKLAVLASAACYVLPSHSENFGIAFAEAMAAGVPCIGCHGVAVAVQAAEAEAALVVDSSADAMAAELERVLGNVHLRTQLGANARRFAQAHFSSEAVGSALVRQYAQILARGKLVHAIHA